MPIEDSAAPIRDKEGRVFGVVIVFHDVTEKRRAREALQESEERLRLFIGHAPASLAMFDRSMRYLSASRRWLTDFNLEQIDLTGLSHYEMFPEISEKWKHGPSSRAGWRGGSRRSPTGSTVPTVGSVAACLGGAALV